ncbi:Melibiose/raffinose/stachyose import permease protein MelD [Paenibacillus allorhizoplanae]|uniref:Melibiose/raffinose/stachyose import permease protein MelD n=1 Tax=Paenibacillus allorhizoplanae TaxID=2905648 RepID=A0ABM9CY02_9BACL|nr:sugar ABC transporter permease [Paenibacillus allorhizoplanae]CAH1226187.1 Melibiose/raffinose/stachyose import permease protein MelD [Paenibacillus allorhizoplanae]
MRTQPTTNANKQAQKRFSAFNWKGRWESPVAGYLFISPWLLGFLLLTLWPMIRSVYYSFTKFTLLDAPDWIGLRNYERIFADDETFRQSLTVTLMFVVISVPIKLVTALLVAMLLNKNIKGISIYRTFIYLPSLIGSSIAVAVLWKNIFGIDGFINKFLSIFGIEGISWISSPGTALGTLIILVAWQFGSSMVIFLAGLKQIPSELYEASSVDGASKLRQFFNITLPMLSPVLLFNLVLQTIGSFQMFTQAFIITKGGPINSTYMYALYLYERAFARYDMGYASALAWILLVIIGIATALIFASSRYWVFYETEGGRKK